VVERGAFDRRDIAQPAEAERRAEEVEAEVGHPGAKWDALRASVSGKSLEQFSDVQQGNALSTSGS